MLERRHYQSITAQKFRSRSEAGYNIIEYLGGMHDPISFLYNVNNKTIPSKKIVIFKTFVYISDTCMRV